MPKLKNISFVMPVRDEEPYLRTAVESVFAQQVPGKMELILAIAPSKDKTMDIALGLAKEVGEKLQIVCGAPNVPARWSGVSLATGWC